jgi:hypothetical protein
MFSTSRFPRKNTFFLSILSQKASTDDDLFEKKDKWNLAMQNLKQSGIIRWDRTTINSGGDGTLLG